MKLLSKIIDIIIPRYRGYKIKKLKNQLGYCGSNVDIRDINVYNPQNLYLYDNTNILDGFVFISDEGKLYFKRGSAAAQHLTVITDSHNRKIQKFFKDPELFINKKGNTHSDVIVEEDVWIGANVSILSGVVVGRGSNVGTGSVLRSSMPPYSIVTGNPAKVVGFVFTPEEIIEHEKVLYPEDERLPLELLEKNYNKYFLKRLKEIKEFTRI